MSLDRASREELVQMVAELQPRVAHLEAELARQREHDADDLQRAAQLSLLRWGLLAFPPLFLFIQGIKHRFIEDDAFIDYRIVRNVLYGFGPVFNASERIEAFTSPLWTGLLVVWGALGLPIASGSVFLGIVFAVAGLLFALHASLALRNPIPDS
jgi:arabinofuranosyltransferase